MLKFNKYVITYGVENSKSLQFVTDEVGTTIGLVLEIRPKITGVLPTPYSRTSITRYLETTIKIRAFGQPSTEQQYPINLGYYPIYFGYINIDKSGQVELVKTHEYFRKSSYFMNNTEYEPGWLNSNIKDIVGEGINGYINGYVSNISNEFKVKVDTTNGNDTLILPYEDYGVTQTQWINDIHGDVELIVERKEPVKYILDSNIQLVTPDISLSSGLAIVSNDNAYIVSAETPSSNLQIYSDFERAIRLNNKQKIRITYLLNNTVFNDSEIVSGSFAFVSNGTDKTCVKFGNAYSNEVSFQLFSSDKTQALNLQNEFKVEFGIITSDASAVADEIWLTLGYFKSKDITYDKTMDIYNIVAYDRMTHFDIEAEDFIDHLDANILYDPKDMFELVCKYVGVDYEPLSYSPTRKVSKSNFTNIHTLRDMLNKIAETYCSYAKITGDGKVKIEEAPFSIIYPVTAMYNSHCYQLSETNQKKNYDNSIWNDIAKFTWNELCGTKWNELYDNNDNYYFHGVKVVLSNDQVITYPTNLSSEEILRDCYVIEDNPFYNGYINPDYISELPDVIRDTIYAQLTVNFQLPYSTEVSTGDYYILAEPGDVIKKYLDDNTTYYLMPVYNRSFSWNGSFICGISSAKTLNEQL